MTHRHRKLRTRRNHTGRNGALLGLVIAVAVVGIGALAAVGYVVAVAASSPDIAKRKPIDKGETSVIFAADGSRLGYVQSDTIRTPIAWKDMPPFVRQATVAIEDERFYKHKGVDYQSIFRAAYEDVASGRTKQGCSTITQQLVRALYI